MLLNNEIKITITNDGKNNNVQLSLNQKYKLNEVMTSIQMAQNTLRDRLSKYLEIRDKITEIEFEELLKTITLEDLYVE